MATPPFEAKDTRNLFITLGVFLLVMFAAGMIPAKWFGIDPIEKRYAKIDLTGINLGEIAQDADRDGSITWNELITSTIEPSELSEYRDRTPDPESIAALNDENNLTASFSKNLYVASSYLSKKPASSAEEEQGIINELIAGEAAKTTFTAYTTNNIKIAKSESQASLHTYGNKLAQILGEIITEESVTNAIGGLQTFFDTEDKTALDRLKGDVARMDTMLNSLLLLETPPSLAQHHLATVNNIAAYRDLLYNLSKVAEDPLRASLFIEKYMATAVAAVQVYNYMRIYFETKGIIFSDKESGYVFMVSYTLK